MAARNKGGGGKDPYLPYKVGPIGLLLYLGYITSYITNRPTTYIML